MSLKHFTREEFDCQVSGTNNMERDFLEKMDELRERMKGVRGVEEIRKFRKESLALIARRPSPNK